MSFKRETLIKISYKLHIDKIFNKFLNIRKNHIILNITKIIQYKLIIIFKIIAFGINYKK